EANEPLTASDLLGRAEDNRDPEGLDMPGFRRFDAPSPEPAGEEPSYAPSYTAEEEEEYDEELPDPADDEEYESPGSGAGYASLVGGLKKRQPDPDDEDWDEEGAEQGEDDALELTMEAGDNGGNDDEGSDELLLDASRLAAGDGPGQGGAGSGQAGSSGGGGGAGAAGGVAGGSTLFERMANLSRAGRLQADEDEDEEGEDDGVGSLNIPRFLGRQNNQ